MSVQYLDNAAPVMIGKNPNAVICPPRQGDPNDPVVLEQEEPDRTEVAK